MSPSAIAQNLRSARESLGLKQNKAARLAGYSARHLRRLETEGTLDLGVLQKIADGWGLHLAMLIWPPEEWKRVALSITSSEVKDWFNQSK